MKVLNIYLKVDLITIFKQQTSLLTNILKKLKHIIKAAAREDLGIKMSPNSEKY